MPDEEDLIMRNSWTKFNFVMMIISMIAGLILVIVLTSMAAISYSYKGSAAIIFFVGTFLVLAFHSLWGLFIEMSKNIMNLAHTVDGTTGENVNSVRGNSDEETWVCASCGHSNSIQCIFCQNCGSPSSLNEHSEEFQASSEAGKDENSRI